MCGNVRAILYPFEKILRRQQKFFIRGCFLLLPGIPHQRLITRGAETSAQYQLQKVQKLSSKFFMKKHKRKEYEVKTYAGSGWQSGEFFAVS